MPAAVNFAGGGALIVTTSGIAVFSGSADLLMTLTVTGDGPAPLWQSQALNPSLFAGVAGPGCPAAAYDLGFGQWQAFTIGPPAGKYATGTLSSVPSISVPLPASLAASTTYHVVLRQEGGSDASYVQAALDPGALASAARTRPATGGTWTGLPATYSLLMEAFDQSAGGPVLHLLEDSGARVTTCVWGSATGALLGVLEATVFPAGAPEPVMAAVTQVAYAAGIPSGTAQLA
jgi:hypothetical protein